MTTQPNNKLLYALANTLGKPLAWVLRKQLSIVSWLVSKGWSRGVAKLMVKALNIFILTLILLIMLPGWMALVGLFGAICLIAGIKIDSPTKNEEWREGIDGYGLYDNHFDMRIDGGHANDDNNPNKHF